MNIQLHCPGCNRELTFPRNMAGCQTKCPGCSHPLYVPTPPDELTELPLAPDDHTARIREATLLAERRKLDRIIAGDDDSPQAEPAAARPRPMSVPQPAASNIEQLIVGYLVAMRDSDLTRAETCLARLREQRVDALNQIDRLAADQIPPAAVQSLPPGVYQGFLRNLRTQL